MVLPTGAGVAQEVHYEERDGIAILSLDRPVANALAATLRCDLQKQLETSIGAPGVVGIVIRGVGSNFSSGVDIGEYETGLIAPWVSDLALMIEDSPKPVVAALHGAAMGAGFELALAAHARVAHRDTNIALSDIKLGLTPGAGATQRAPRLVGAQVALELMLSGQIVAASHPRMKRFFDQLVEDDPLGPAIEMARDLAATGKVVPTRDRTAGFSAPAGFQKAVAKMAKRAKRAPPAAAEIVRCVEAAQLLPFERGLDLERCVFEERLQSSEARARRHFFAAERRAAIMPELAQGKASPIEEVALLGRGEVLAELAITLLDAGRAVCLASGDEEHNTQLRQRVRMIYDRAVELKRLAAADRHKRFARLTTGDVAVAAMRADLVLDARHDAEKPDLKQGAIHALLDAGAGLGANAGLACRPYRPAHSTAVVEIYVAPEVSVDAVATVVRLFSDTKRTVVRCAPVAMGVGHSLSSALYLAALCLAEAGYAPFEVDAAAQRAGWHLGPFRMIDTEGLVLVKARLDEYLRARDLIEPPALSILSRRIGDAATGRGTGQGFYRYPKGKVLPVAGLAGAAGSDRPDLNLEKVLHASIVNEAARLLAAKAVQRASDLDVLMVKGLGYDVARGGPLMQADLGGLFGVMKTLRETRPIFFPALMTPQPMIEALVKNGKGFYGRSLMR